MRPVNQSRSSCPIRIDTPIQGVAAATVATGIAISVISAVRAAFQYHQLFSMAYSAGQRQRFAPSTELDRHWGDLRANYHVAIKRVETKTNQLVKGGMALIFVGLLIYYSVGLLIYYSVDYWGRSQSK